MNEIVLLQIKNPHFANLNDDWNKKSNYLKSFLKARNRLRIFVFLEKMRDFYHLSIDNDNMKNFVVMAKNLT